MNLSTIAAISGKPGLYRIIKPSRSGIIVETVDGSKVRTLVPATSKVSVLGDITMYTTDAEGSVKLTQVFQTLKAQHGAQLPVSHKSDAAQLAQFFAEAVPTYDNERVYASDIKKVVAWYSLLIQHAPDLLEDEVPGTAEETAVETKDAEAEAASVPAVSEQPEAETTAETEAQATTPDAEEQEPEATGPEDEKPEAE